MAVLVAVVGAVRAFRSPASTGVLHDRREAEFVPVWIAVSWAFTSFLLAPVLNDASLVLLGTLLIAVTAGALVAELATDIAASTVTGVGAGSLLTLFAVLALSKFNTGE